MMKEEDKIISRFGKKSPYIAPPGYFESISEEINSKLPDYPAPLEVKLSKWQRIKPYMYLAAMFMGIWLMMQMFHLVSGSQKLDLDNPPAQIAAYMGGDDAEEIWFNSSNLSDEELLDEVSDQYTTIEEFDRDFNSVQVDSDASEGGDEDDYDIDY